MPNSAFFLTIRNPMYTNIVVTTISIKILKDIPEMLFQNKIALVKFITSLALTIS